MFKWVDLNRFYLTVISKITDNYAREYVFTRLADGSSCANSGKVKSMTAPGGKIISYDLKSALRIRTGETDKDAIN